MWCLATIEESASEMRKKNILIISHVPGYNRQGYDLAYALRSSGLPTILLQLDGITDRKLGNIGIKWFKWDGWRYKLGGAFTLVLFILHSLFLKKDVVVCISRLSLLIGALCKKLLGCEVVYYALEYSSNWHGWAGWALRHVVDRYIDVEKNRQALTYQEQGLHAPFAIVPNVPCYHGIVCGGALRSRLMSEFHIDGRDKIVIYAGSYQRYACLDKIIAAADRFPSHVHLVVMAYGMPSDLRIRRSKCIFLPPVNGLAFYDWLADADCALLPYESIDDLNVQYCSPQKIFDCYLVGVPYAASDRPLIREVLAEDESVGTLCDFNSEEAIIAGVLKVLDRKGDVHDRMRELHRSKFNFEQFVPEIIKCVEGVC